MALAALPVVVPGTPAPDPVIPVVTAEQMSIDIANADQAVKPGQRVVYRITVRSTAPGEIPLTVRAALSDSFSDIEAAEATVIGSSLSWKDMVSSGQTRSYTVSAVVSEDSKSAHADVSACIHVPSSITPVDCSIDRHAIAKSAGTGWLAWAVAGLLSIAATGGGLMWMRRRANGMRGQANA